MERSSQREPLSKEEELPIGPLLDLSRQGMALDAQARIDGESGDVIWIPEDAGVDIDELLSSWKASNDLSALVDVPGSRSSHSAATSSQPPGGVIHQQQTEGNAATLEEWFQDFLQAPSGNPAPACPVDAGASALLDGLHSLPSHGLSDPSIRDSPFDEDGLGPDVQAAGASELSSLLLDGFEPWEASCDTGDSSEKAGIPASGDEAEAPLSSSGREPGAGASSASYGLDSDVRSSSVDSVQGTGLEAVSEQRQAEPDLRESFHGSAPPQFKSQSESSVASRAPEADQAHAQGNPPSESGRGQALGQPTALTLRLAAVVRGLTSASPAGSRHQHANPIHPAHSVPLSGSTRANASRLYPAGDGLHTSATATSVFSSSSGITAGPGGLGSKQASTRGGSLGVRLGDKSEGPLWPGFGANDFAVTKEVTAKSDGARTLPPGSAKVPVSSGVAPGTPRGQGLAESTPGVKAPAGMDFPVTSWSAVQGRRRRARSDIEDVPSRTKMVPGPAMGMAQAGSHSETWAMLPLERSPGTLGVTQSQALVHQGAGGRSVREAEFEEEEEGSPESELFRLGLFSVTRRYRRYSGNVRGSSGGLPSFDFSSRDSFSLTYALSASPPPSLALDSGLLPPRPSNPALKRRATAQLIELATAYATDQPLKVRTLCQRLQKIASPQGCATQKLVHYVLKALELRWEGKGVPAAALSTVAKSVKQSNLNNFVNVTGWGAFAEILNTYSVIDALRGHSSVHIILLSDWATLCWPALFKDLARQPGGAPSVRVTSINFVFPDPGNSEVPQSTILGEELRRAAHALGVPLVYQPLRVPHFSFHPGLVRTDPAEAVAVVSAWHLMIFPDSRVLKSNPRNAMLKWVHALSPKVFVLIEADADFNSQFFLARFKEFLVRGVTVYEAFNSRIPERDPERVAMEFLFSQDVANCIACEGLDRFLRMERAEQWSDRLSTLGFKGAKFPQQVWDSLGVLSAIDSRINVAREGEVARLQWLGVPHVFGSAWVPG